MQESTLPTRCHAWKSRRRAQTTRTSAPHRVAKDKGRLLKDLTRLQGTKGIRAAYASLRSNSERSQGQFPDIFDSLPDSQSPRGETLSSIYSGATCRRLACAPPVHDHHNLGWERTPSTG